MWGPKRTGDQIDLVISSSNFGGQIIMELKLYTSKTTAEGSI